MPSHRRMTRRPVEAEGSSSMQFAQVFDGVRVVHPHDPLRPRKILDRFAEMSELPVHERTDSGPMSIRRF